MSNKINYPQQPPINPFRTQHHPQRNSDDSVCIENPILRWCYVVGVMLLLLCLSVVGYNTYTKFPSPNFNLRSGLSGLTGVRSTKTTSTDIKILKPEILFEGKVPSNKNNNQLTLRNADRPNDSGSSSETSLQILPPVVLVQAAKIRSEVAGRDSLDAAYNPDDEIEDEEEVAGNGVQVDDNVENMLRPGEAHAKMLGVTKDQYKLELNQEKYSDHAFGVEQDTITSEENKSQDQEDVKSDNIESDQVVVLFRKGESMNDSTVNGPEHLKADLEDDERLDIVKENEALKVSDTSLHLEDTKNEEQNRINNIVPVVNDDTTRKRNRLRHILIATDA